MNNTKVLNLSLVLGLISSMVMLLNQDYSLLLASTKLSWGAVYVLASSGAGLFLWFKSKSPQGNK